MYGSEFTLMIKMYILPFLKLSRSSYCDNPYCLSPLVVTGVQDCPSLNRGLSLNWITPLDIQHQISSWFNDHMTSTRCGRKIANAPLKYCFQDINTEPGLTSQFCNRTRKNKPISCSIFPPLLPVHITEYGTGKQITNSFPVEITVAISGKITRAYELMAITLWDKSHHTAKLLYNGSWYFYDGMKNGLVALNREVLPDGYTPTYCLYGMVYNV
ncbi:uncharacterized protein LOC130644967 [Hydractinia symbiolongicarpus]|uniref:uncharacterized protein LOC130644967 n=1 Tax=Hydractinia symbiolongicarpus TaxID=13093 RepID=UPI00254D2AA0|nr:uncharacterized protein LOC130644967 [Hydractinia symbiolongicarpus]